jgi:hypothetical protein
MSVLKTPTLYKWAGGIERIEPLFRVFYEIRETTSWLSAPIELANRRLPGDTPA